MVPRPAVLSPGTAAALPAAGAAACLLLLRHRRLQRVRRRLDRLRDPGPGDRERQPVLTRERFEKSGLSSSRGLRKLLEALGGELETAGVREDPVRLLAVWLLLLAGAPAAAGLLGAPVPVLAGAALAAGGLPWAYIRWRRAKNLAAFERQLPYAIDILCNALQAGYTFPMALAAAGKEMEEPAGGQFRAVYRETQYGVPLSRALKNMAARTDSAELALMQTAVSVQTAAGGNMTGILRGIARTLRERRELREEIRSKTASGKLTGILLAVIPVLLLAALGVLNPGYTAVFFETRGGRLTLAAAGAWELLGLLLIRRILKIRY